jgi:hypothetical protein
MIKPGATLAARIRTDLAELAFLVERARKGWDKAKSLNDDYYLDGVALNLHSFYSSLEKIFEKIAATIDGVVPSAANWHQELLSQMSMDIPEVRPAVISQELREMLEDYRGFRHVVRNVYTHQLNPDKIELLIAKIEPVLVKLTAELNAFATFLLDAE